MRCLFGKPNSKLYPHFACLAVVAPFAGLAMPDGRVIPDSVYCDYESYQLPIRSFVRSELLAGRVPLWMPQLACGQPLHAMQQAGVFYPLATPLIMLLGTGYGLKLSILFHFALLYYGQYYLTRRLHCSRLASCCSGMIATWSGFAIAHLMQGHVTILFGFAVVPWTVVAIIALIESPGPKAASLLAATGACLFLTGHPQLPYYATIFVALWAAGSLVWGKARRVRRTVLLWGSVATFCSVLLCAVQLVPALELLAAASSVDERGSNAYASQFALQPVDFLRLWCPNLFGNPFVGLPSYKPFDFFHERVGFVGCTAPLLAVCALASSTVCRWEWCAATAILTLLLLAMGDCTPLFNYVGTLMPGFVHFRCPGRLLGIATLLIAILAARGLDSLRIGVSHKSRTSLLLFLTVLDLTYLGYIQLAALLSTSDGAAYMQFATRLWDEILITVAVTTAAICIVVCAVFFRGRTMAGAIILTCGVELLIGNVRNFHLSASGPTSDIAQPDQSSSSRFVEIGAADNLRSLRLRYSRLVPFAVTHHRLTIGTNDGGVLPVACQRLYRAAERQPEIALAAASCSHAWAEDSGSWISLNEPLPRLRALTGDTIDYASIPIEKLERGHIEKMRRNPFVKLVLLDEDPGRVVLQATCRRPSLVVISDLSEPGWRCTVDGREAESANVHGVFRGVHVGEGIHTIVWSYRPKSFRIGLLLSTSGIITILLMLVYGINRRGILAKDSL